MDLEISNNAPYTNFTLTGNQLKIFRYLNKIANNYSLGDIYQGAWQVYKDRNLKDRYSLAAHAFRELIDRLTDEKIGKSSQSPKDIVKEISELYKKWEECKAGESNNFNQELDSFFTSFKNRSGRKERYKNLMIINDPLYKKLPEEVFKSYNKTITELYKYFSNLAHHIHNKNDAENFDKKIAMLEDLLGALFTENIIEKHNNIDEFIKEYENNTSDINIEQTIDTLKGVGANLSYFFKKIKSPKWLVLFENPFFKKHENQDFYDQLQYILAISNNYPEYQDKIALIIYSTIYGDRISEHVCRIKIIRSLNLSVQYWREILLKEYKWLSIQKYIEPLLSKEYENLIYFLLENDFYEEVCQFFYTIFDIKNAPDKFKKINTKIEYSTYGYTLKEILKFKNVRSHPEILKIICSLVSRVLKITSSKPSPDDYSYIWRRRIENPDYATEDVKEILIGSLVWLCKTRISEKSLNLENCLKILSEYDWYVFDRIALYLLREYGDEDSIEVISQKLRDDNLYDEKNVSHEYYELLKKFFINLDSQMKNFIIKRILDKSFDYLRIEYGYSEDNVKEEKERWQRDKLEPISNYLPENEKQYYHALIEKYGETEYPGFSSELPQVKMGPNSPIKLEDLKSKSVEEIIQYLNEWKPIQNDMFDPSIEGLGRVLEDVIISDPNKYILKLDLFETIKEPTYFRSLLSAFRNLTNNNKTIEWGKVINFCVWILDHEADFPDLKLMGDEKFSRDSGLKHAKHTMASLFYSALSSTYENEKGLYPYQAEIWKILEILTEDEDPTLDREKEDCESKNYDSLAINSIRGEALHAVVRYALWRYRKEQNENKPTEELKNFFTDFIPEVKLVLEKHLDKKQDPLISIHTIYGQWLPWFVLMDKKWVEDHLNDIFPKDESNLEYRKAAWRTYIYLCDPYNDIYKIIKPEYNYWVSRLNKKDFNDDINKQLAQHLMTFYWRGYLKLEELDQFFNIASQEVRKEALTFIGLSLTREDKEKIPKEVMDKFENLWTARFKKISNNYDLDEHLGELSTFVWWLRSDKFERNWALKQLKNILGLIGFPDDIQVLFKVLRDFVANLQGDEEWVIDLLDCLIVIISSEKWADQNEYWNFDVKEIVRQIKLKFKEDQIKEKVEPIAEKMIQTGYFSIKEVLE